MNTMLKVLGAVALVMVIVVSGSHIVMQIGLPPTPLPGPRPSDNSNTSTSVSTRLVAGTTAPPIIIEKDSPVQPSYRPINQPSYIQFLRQEGKTYHSRVVGKVTGQASKKDWGIRGVAYFDYLYAVESTGKIVQNDGVTVIEERFFSKVHENLLTSGYELRVELPDKLHSVFSVLALLGPQGAGIAVGGESVMAVANNSQLTVKKEWVEAARKAGLFRDLPAIDPQQFEREIKMFTQGSDNKLLEGKTVRITFKDGSGVSETIGVGCDLRQQEKDVIKRTNFVMDHYLFPDREVAPGADWSVDGSVFAGFLDPRLNGKVGGKVAVMRTPDFVDATGKVSKKLKITDGQVIIRDETGPTNITGQITSLKGVCVLPDDFGVVTSAQLHGYAEYRNVSRDHLLFEAQTTVQPKIEIRYECTVE